MTVLNRPTCFFVLSRLIGDTVDIVDTVDTGDTSRTLVCSLWIALAGRACVDQGRSNAIALCSAVSPSHARFNMLIGDWGFLEGELLGLLLLLCHPFLVTTIGPFK